MKKVISKDGTTIAFDRLGEGPAIILDAMMPTLVLDGSASPAYIHEAAEALAMAMPQAERKTLEGQTHQVSPEALAPVLVEFFTSSVAGRSSTKDVFASLPAI